MKLSEQWLREWVDPDVDTLGLAEQLTMAGLEVDGIEPCAPALDGVVVGEGSGEMINEWALAVQKKVRMHEIMMLQHSFPTMGFLSKRVAENWMMAKMKRPLMRAMCRLMF